MLEDLGRRLYDCSRCGFCRVWGWEGVEHVCPTYPFTPGWETHYARGRVRLAQATLEGQIEPNQAFLEHAYACTLCGSCEAHCPVGVPLVDIFHAWRVDLAAAGHALPAHRQVLQGMRRHLNPYGPRPDEPATPPRPATVLFYPGCTTNRMAGEIVAAVTGILERLGLDAALFADDTCCGFPLYELGQVQAAGDVAQITLERIAAYRPDVLLTTCPACYKTFKHILPQELGLTVPFEVEHISTFLLPQVQGRLNARAETITWHDPCVLGRHLGMYDEPRELLRAVPDLELREMAANRQDALCCGAGGGVYFACQKMANEAVVHRLQQAVEVGAQAIVTSCPNCYVRFRQMSRQRRLPIQARELSQVIAEALDLARR